MSSYSDPTITLDHLKEMRRILVEQRQQGVLQWTFNGQTKIYTSPREMLVVIEEISREIQRRVAKALNLVPVRPWDSYGVIRPLEPQPTSEASE